MGGGRLRRTTLAIALALVGLIPGTAHAGKNTFLTSATSNSAEAGDGTSLSPAMSQNGRWVVFASAASNLSDDNHDGFNDDDTNGHWDVFVADTDKTTCPSSCVVRVSKSTPNEQQPYGGQADGDSFDPFKAQEFTPSISSDGRYVAFASRASNLDGENKGGTTDVYVHDRDLDANGIMDEAAPGRIGREATFRVSVSSDGRQADEDAFFPAISGNGLYVAFVSKAANLVEQKNSGFSDVYVHGPRGTFRMSVTSAGQRAKGNSTRPSLSADGRYVVFESSAPNLLEAQTTGGDTADTNNVTDVFIHDRNVDNDQEQIFDQPGTTKTSRVSVGPLAGNGSSYGQSNGASISARITRDGKSVVFLSKATNLLQGTPGGAVVPNAAPVDQNQSYDVYVRDLTRNVTSLASVDSEGNATGVDELAPPAISDNGLLVAFQSAAGSLVDGDNNGVLDVFVRDLAVGTTTRVSTSNDGGSEGDGPSGAPAIDGLGGFVAYQTLATNLVDIDLVSGVSQVAHASLYACLRPENGPVSGLLHDTVEPQAGPARGTIHDQSCQGAANGI